VNQLFEHDGGSHSTPASPAHMHTTFNTTFSSLNAPSGSRSSGGSFGIDYGAFKQPSLGDLQEDESLDELAASPPVIRTAKPPSGFSPLTAPPKAAGRDVTPMKSFLRGGSRPSSKGSAGSKDRDDTSTIGSLSIEPGVTTSDDLRRKSSGDSWGKKQARNSKGLMYMSSKERLREREQERKRVSGPTVAGKAKTGGLDRIPLPHFDTESFMAESVIGEEPEESSPPKPESAAAVPRTRGVSPALAAVSPGGIGSGRFIPARDSSLRNSTGPGNKRSSQRSSRQSSKQRASEDGDDSTQRSDVQKQERKRERSRRDHQVLKSEGISSMMEPLDDLEMPPPNATMLANKKVRDSGYMEELQPVESRDEGAPAPAVPQRKARVGPDHSSSQKRRSTKAAPEPLDITASQTKRSGSRTKRSSAPLSPSATEKDPHQRSTSNPLLSRVGSPEPTKQPQIHVDDRPSSADSIDDAVEAYLRSPRLSQKIKHPQTGRTISFSEVGDSEGFAVFCCVGMGLTRYIMAFYDELALTLKLRLITPDRPGVGDSEPYTDGTSTPLSWPGMSCSGLLLKQLLTSRR
jgi:hypothetical protein